jgi:PAS domain S-box-containing protein
MTVSLQMNVSDMVAQALLSTRSDAIIAADRSGKITFWNAGAERIFGHSGSAAVGKSLDIIIPERLRQRHWKGYRRAMEVGSSRYSDGEILAAPAVTSDGSQISLEFTIVFLRDESGQLAGLAAVLRDVTKRFEEVRSLRRKVAKASASVVAGSQAAVVS